MTTSISVSRPFGLAGLVASLVSGLGLVSPLGLPLAYASPGAPAPVSLVGSVESEMTVDICLNLPDWQRPPNHVQQKQLQTMDRYRFALQDEPLVSLAKDWWSHEVFSFTTYGLSARTDPLYLSGLWTAIEATWTCYDGSQPEQINDGDLAEVWLINHRLVSLQWQESQYLMVVEPGQAGLQLIQFPRREREQPLPLSLITVTGEALAVMSGDW
ncbi:MAG TPA: hypothetical protein IGR64_07080 [Leptolyngbyaceae cyanobacterium M65_K2018_010]|nr:hypothetical protein [Leptolyngbyaceae cyanobacterium M65_K2018_010]